MSWGTRALVLVGMLVAAVTGATVLLSREGPPALSVSSPSTTSPTIEVTTTTSVATTVTTAPKPTTTTTVRRVPSTTRVPTTVTTARPPTTAPTTTSAGDALSLLNRDRTSRGLPALKPRADAQAKAQAWAERLAREGKGLYHSTMSDGLAPCTTGIGENIASASSVTQAEQILMDDPPHRANILASRWNWVGVGVARTPTGVIVVQVFMSGCL